MNEQAKQAGKTVLGMIILFAVTFGIISTGITGFVPDGAPRAVGDSMISNDLLRVIYSAIAALVPLIGSALMGDKWKPIQMILDIIGVKKKTGDELRDELRKVIDGIIDSGLFAAKNDDATGIRLSKELYENVLLSKAPTARATANRIAGAMDPRSFQSSPERLEAIARENQEKLDELRRTAAENRTPEDSQGSAMGPKIEKTHPMT